MKDTFSKKLLMFRAEHNLTQRELSQILEVCENMVFKYEKELNKPTKKNEMRYEIMLKEWEELNR